MAQTETDLPGQKPKEGETSVITFFQVLTFLPPLEPACFSFSSTLM